jgi:hypothetical protein
MLRQRWLGVYFNSSPPAARSRALYSLSFAWSVPVNRSCASVERLRARVPRLDALSKLSGSDAFGRGHVPSVQSGLGWVLISMFGSIYSRGRRGCCQVSSFSKIGPMRKGAPVF